MPPSRSERPDRRSGTDRRRGRDRRRQIRREEDRSALDAIDEWTFPPRADLEGVYELEVRDDFRIVRLAQIEEPDNNPDPPSGRKGRGRWWRWIHRS